MKTNILLFLIFFFIVLLLLFYYINLESNIIILLSIVVILLLNNLIVNKEYFQISEYNCEIENMDKESDRCKNLKGNKNECNSNKNPLCIFDENSGQGKDGKGHCKKKPLKICTNLNDKNDKNDTGKYLTYRFNCPFKGGETVQPQKPDLEIEKDKLKSYKYKFLDLNGLIE